MSHPEQAAFFAAVADANNDLVQGGRVLEIGSYDVNGTIRSLFAGSAEYVGVDLTEGPGVDVVSFGHEYTSDKPFDAAISGECFEHDPHWADSLATMIRLTRPGGLVAFELRVAGPPGARHDAEPGRLQPRHAVHRLRLLPQPGRRRHRGRTRPRGLLREAYPVWWPSPDQRRSATSPVW